MASLIDIDQAYLGETAPNRANDPILNDSIQTLINQWRNEVHSPEILPYKNDLLDDVMAMLKSQIVRNFDLLYYPLQA